MLLVEMFLNNILIGTLTHVKNVGGNCILKQWNELKEDMPARSIWWKNSR